jgi:hypothetical protein
MDPCHLVWQVNEIFEATEGDMGLNAVFYRIVTESDSPAGRAGRGLFKEALLLARNLVHPPDKPAGVSRQPIGQQYRTTKQQTLAVTF